MKNWKMTKKDEVNFYFCMMISFAVILIVTSLHFAFKIVFLVGFLSNLYLLCKASKELKEEEAQKKAEEDAKEVVVEEITEE